MPKQLLIQNKSAQRLWLWVAIALLLLVWTLSMLAVSQISASSHTNRMPIVLGMPALDAASKDALSSGHGSVCLVRADYCGDGA